MSIGLKVKIRSLHDQWVAKVSEMTDEDFQSDQYSRWPFDKRGFADVALWLNGEFMKNTAEIGSGRFLNAAVKG